MDAHPSGWYDDPDNDELLRYWDGVVWTEHTAFKRPRSQSSAVVPDGDSAQVGTAAGLAGSTGSTDARDRSMWAPGSVLGSRAASGAWQGTGRIAADGLPYAGWFRRVVAFLLDAVVVGVIATPFAWSTLSTLMPTWDAWILTASQAVEAGRELPVLPESVVTGLNSVSLIILLVTLVYEVVLVARFGATAGMFALGFRIRAVGQQGPAPWFTVVRRTMIKYVSSFFGAIPLLGNLAFGFTVINYLWPLWDANRQALHDKWSGTEVVRVPPRHRA